MPVCSERILALMKLSSSVSLARQLAVATPTCINGKCVAISGAGGQAATANCRTKLTELLSFIKANVLPEQTGIAVPAEAWTTDVLTLTDEQKSQLKNQAEKLVSLVNE